MQTVPASVCFAKSANSALPVLSIRQGFKNISSRCSIAVNAPVHKPLGSLVIGFGASALALRFAHQASRSVSAVRLTRRLEMLQRRVEPVRRSRFAPAALPPISSSGAAPRRSAGVRSPVLRRLPSNKFQSQLGQFVLPATQPQCSIGSSLSHNTAKNVLPNQSLNRTRCGMPSFGPSFHSGPNAVTPQRAG
jgi:hypothetical protein